MPRHRDILSPFRTAFPAAAALAVYTASLKAAVEAARAAPAARAPVAAPAPADAYLLALSARAGPAGGQAAAFSPAAVVVRRGGTLGPALW